MSARRKLKDLETQRVALQGDRDAGRTQDERNRLGQFATPGALASDILSYARGLLDPNSVRFLDPAIGTGSFYSGLLSQFAPERIEAALGFEIDPHYGEPCRELWKGTPLTLRMEDFTAAKPPQTESERFNLVICNPPYVRHHHIPAPDKARLQMRSMMATGLRLNGLAGLYCHFMTAAHPWMQNDAIAGWLVPSEFMDVNYGRELKRYLMNSVTLLRIHRFEPSDVQFSDALVSSAIVWLRNRKPPRDYEVDFTFGGSLADPNVHGGVPVSRLDLAPKWTGFPAALTRTQGENVPTLGDYFRVKRGIATGSNDFFIMTYEQAAERGVPHEFLRPILPGSRYLEGEEVDADEVGNPLLSRKLFLLDCRLPEASVRAQYPALWNYLESGKPTVATTYLCSKRAPWYSQENREPTFFICTYIARTKKDGRTQRFIFNRSKAIAANTYLMLYPRERLGSFIAGDPGRARLVWQELTKIHSDTITAGGRVYGGGMYKVEPMELSSVPVPGLSDLLARA